MRSPFGVDYLSLLSNAADLSLPNSILTDWLHPMMLWKPVLYFFLCVRSFCFGASFQVGRSRHPTARSRSLPLHKRGGQEGGGLRKTTSQAALLDSSGNPAPDLQDAEESSSRGQSIWSHWRGGARSESSHRSSLPPGDRAGPSSSSGRFSRTSRAMPGGSPRSSLSNEPWNRFGPSRLERHEEHEEHRHGSSPSSSSHGGDAGQALGQPGPPSEKQGTSLGRAAKNVWARLRPGWRNDPVEQSEPPEFHVDEAKLRAQLRPKLEQQAKHASDATHMSYKEKARAVHQELPDASRS